MRVGSLFDQIGADGLRRVIADFYDRLFADVMIGFLFAGKDKQRLIDREYEFTAHFLGADVGYTGRPLRQAHARSPILGGHFERRLQILRNTLSDHQVAPEVQTRWLEHTLALRAQVTADQGSECADSATAERINRETAPPGDPGLVRLGRK
jgi:hemoglobin